LIGEFKKGEKMRKRRVNRVYVGRERELEENGEIKCEGL